MVPPRLFHICETSVISFPTCFGCFVNQRRSLCLCPGSHQDCTCAGLLGPTASLHFNLSSFSALYFNYKTCSRCIARRESSRRFVFHEELCHSMRNTVNISIWSKMLCASWKAQLLLALNLTFFICLPGKGGNFVSLPLSFFHSLLPVLFALI